MSDIHIGNWEGDQYTLFDSTPGATAKDCMITVCVDKATTGNAQLNGYSRRMVVALQSIQYLIN